jgi:hypothetical protein
MPSRRRFPLLPSRSAPATWAGAICVLGVLLAAARPARADENLLRGPHPFRRDNQLSVHVLVASGRADTMSGTKLAFDYDYKLTGGWSPLWLDLAVNAQHGACSSAPSASACSPDSGDVYETLGGVRWMFVTPLPLVPYVGASAGFVFAFPNGASAASGLAFRAVGGANYFFFDWLGVGGQVGYSLGGLGYDSTFKGSHTYAVLDFGGGLVFQF